MGKISKDPSSGTPRGAPPGASGAPGTPGAPGTSDHLEKIRWFEDEVHAHDAKLKSYLRRSFPTVDVADVVQESYLRTWVAHAANPIKSAKSFLFAVARRQAIDVLRHRKKSPIVDAPDLTVLGVMDEGRSPAEAAIINDEIALLAEAIDSLPPRCREIILLRTIQDIPQREVAARLGITETTVGAQVYHGIFRVEAYLARRGVVGPWKKNRKT